VLLRLAAPEATKNIQLQGEKTCTSELHLCTWDRYFRQRHTAATSRTTQMTPPTDAPTAIPKVEPAAVELVGRAGVGGARGVGALIGGKVAVALSSAMALRSWNNSTVGAGGFVNGFRKSVITIVTCDPMLKVPMVSFMVSTPKAKATSQVALMGNWKMHVDTANNRRLDVEEGGMPVGPVKGFQAIKIFNPAVDEPIKEVRGVNLTTAEVMAPANVLAGVMVKSLITPHCATVVSKDKVTNKLVDFMMRRTIHSSCQLRSLRLLGMAVTVSPHHHRPPPPTAPTQAVCTSVCDDDDLGRGCIRQNC
jgi:hypothetical protein